MATFGEKLMESHYGVTFSDIPRKIRHRASFGVLKRHSANNWLDGDICRKIDKKSLGVTHSDILRKIR